MKITTFVLAIGIVPLAMAAITPSSRKLPFGVYRVPDKPAENSESPEDYIVSLSSKSSSEDNSLTRDPENVLEPRGMADEIRTKKKCDSMFKSDKTPYVIACAGEPDQDSKNLCELRALVGDASVECRAALLKNMGF